MNGRKLVLSALALLVLVTTLAVLASPAPALAETSRYAPITIQERSGSTLYNYTVRIELNSTNFDGWSLLTNASTIYFTDNANNPLYYWVEEFNKTARHAVVWVKVPEIPAGGEVTIRMYYGGSNPYQAYNNASKAFLFYTNFDTNTLPSDTLIIIDDNNLGTYSISDGVLTLTAQTNHDTSFAEWVINKTFPGNIIIETKTYVSINLGSDQSGVADINLYVNAEDGSDYLYKYQLYDWSNGDGVDYGDYGIPGVYCDNNVNCQGGICNLDTWTELLLKPNTEFPTDAKPAPAPRIVKIYNISFFAGTWWGSSGTTILKLDSLTIRAYADPEPLVSVGASVLGGGGFASRSYVFNESYGGVVIDYSSDTVRQLGFHEDFSRNVLELPNWTQVYLSDTAASSRIVFAWDQANGRVYVAERAAGSGESGYYSKLLAYMFPENITYPLNTRLNITAVLYETSETGTMGHSIMGAANFSNPASANYSVDYTDISVAVVGFSDGWTGTTGQKYFFCQGTGYGSGAGTWNPGVFTASLVFTETGVQGYLDGSLYKSCSPNMTKYNITSVYWWVSFDTSYPADTGGYIDDLVVKAGFVVVRGLPAGSSVEVYVGNSLIGEKSVSDNSTVYFLFDPELLPSDIKVVVKTPAVSAIYLPKSSAILTHTLSYAPNSTQFSHSFSATNSTEAGYETNYTSPSGWRVWAEPYESGGTGYENTASLVSEVNITLPYTQVLVRNVTLLASANGTGAYRRLWVRVLNSTGGVLAELGNATLSSGWTLVTLPVDANVSGQLTVWVNATVKSTDSSGEQIAVKDVRVSVEHASNPQFTVGVEPNKDFFNCSAPFTVDIASGDMLGYSALTLKLVEYLSYNTTDYPVGFTPAGSETIGSLTYNVYRAEPANQTGSYTVYALLGNALRTARVHVRGYETTEVLVGEKFTVELPVPGNVTIPELNATYVNATAVSLRLTEPTAVTIAANVSELGEWRLGYWVVMVSSRLGRLSVEPVDQSSAVVDYEPLTLRLVNRTSGAVVAEATGNRLFQLSDLQAGNYTLQLVFRDLVVGEAPFELNITTDNSTVGLEASMLRLPVDYRGLARAVVYPHGKQLLGVENLSPGYPYSRLRIRLNGTGAFKLYLDYRGDLPSKVSVTGNVSGLSYYWSGDYLAVTGTLGSVGVVNVTDLYRLRVEAYDRLGNLMPSWMYVLVGSARYQGPVADDYYPPGNYSVVLPGVAGGFEFYGFWDGYNATVREVAVNTSDVTLRAWYRVPTSVEAESYQVSVFLIPVIRQDEETVSVYVEGHLKDYYGRGVPGRNVTVEVVNRRTGYARSYTLETDVAGYFRSPVMQLVRGDTYDVRIAYAGDDVYVGSAKTLEVKPSELPAAPPPIQLPAGYVVAAVGAVLLAVGVFVAAKTLRHTVQEIREKRMKYVRKRSS